MTERSLVVVQARAGSTRLPGKVLAEVAGLPMLGFQLARLLAGDALGDATVVVATSDLPGDDAVAEVAAEAGVAVVRGSEQDVLDRFALAHRQHGGSPVVRLTGDCPFTDPALVREVLDLHVRVDADHTSNVLPRSYPKGLDVEVLSVLALEAAAAEAGPGPDREHVTPFVYRRPERFRLANLDSGLALAEEWWTVDTAEDLGRVRAIAAAVADPLRATWPEILDAVGRNAEPGAGEIVLTPLPSAEPGSNPWVRRWTVSLDGETLGTASVSAGSGTVERRIDAPVAQRTSAEEALTVLLAGDQQTRH